MIVIDDGPDLHPPEIMDEIGHFPNMTYIIGDREDLGISEGRNIGVRMVKTKYFINLDDDYVVSEHTDMPKMLEMLDTTDLSLVGGKCKRNFAGFMEFRNDKETGKSALMYYPGSCTVKSEELSSYPGCYRCDLTANGFMARTRDILDVGGWSKEVKIGEHKDIFLRLKAARKKVVFCENCIIQNVHSDKGVELNDEIENSFNKKAYRKLRYRRKQQMGHIFLNHWNVDKLIEIENKTNPRTWD
ncbi:beta-1,4 N-acetylgalactosaminyltransferase 1-like [Bolinopsis microptera]|uniref:beta-1,4 N-acetylgalactosaminyltransferase 1-like n=1 Tax=Bolinopsis microptera TaxID=2820187 RepID=UPI00307B0C39